ncbi:aminopeptidase P family protein [Parvularcula flava]|uniref:Aminopeptidase P family protein n=1 Tax=Aquisalinus luteolus TaxID=1566827 RepID=A0A8J3AA52_9PROT|nr:aminopeptidase P family protein [Aquisalinus luteolus]NHK29060.1 aminopeptidase P family protein [Aquisalinus luteolus]GGI00433.1 Xaa-Pro aminopeptidase [Aquisalinus luteolus]
MFQTFDPASDRSFAEKHLPAMREEMQKQNLDGFLVPHDDEYLNEYLPDNAERLMWASGFSGSAGSAIVFTDSAVIFTDGRYTVQVREQVDDQFFAYEDLTSMPPEAWLTKHGQEGQRIGFDPHLHSANHVKALKAAAKHAGFELVAVDDNPIDVAWQGRPASPMTPVEVHPDEFAGKSSAEKRAEVAAVLKDKKADAVVLTAPHSLAWLFNIRGKDVHATPLPLGRAILFADGTASLFIHPDKMSDEVEAHLGDDVSVYPEEKVGKHLDKLEDKTVLIDPAIAPYWFFRRLKKADAKVLEGADPCALPRACKTPAEIEGSRQAHIRDGRAVTRFLHWIATEAQDGTVTEIQAAQKLEEFRRQSNLLKDISFDTISAAVGHGALPHYRVTTNSDRTLDQDSLYLVDSGGQYPDGTTDITRTVAIGTPTAEMKERYTLVLKGHIALALARFPKGTPGIQLDTLARMHLWNAGLDYDHGTGHGVGSYLGVHEGPQNISKKPITQPLMPGMICSNEPGYYKVGEYGIRIENLIVVNNPEPVEGGDREMMSFETVTMAPLDRHLIDTSLLTEIERDWVNAYHAVVYEKLADELEDDVRDWLTSATAPL